MQLEWNLQRAEQEDQDESNLLSTRKHKMPEAW